MGAGAGAAATNAMMRESIDGRQEPKGGGVLPEEGPASVSGGDVTQQGEHYLMLMTRILSCFI